MKKLLICFLFILSSNLLASTERLVGGIMISDLKCSMVNGKSVFDLPLEDAPIFGIDGSKVSALKDHLELTKLHNHQECTEEKLEAIQAEARMTYSFLTFAVETSIKHKVALSNGRYKKIKIKNIRVIVRTNPEFTGNPENTEQLEDLIFTGSKIIDSQDLI